MMFTGNTSQQLKVRIDSLIPRLHFPNALMRHKVLLLVFTVGKHTYFALDVLISSDFLDISQEIQGGTMYTCYTLR
jgi:hypothetical protein